MKSFYPSKDDHVTSFYIYPGKDFNKWLYQNLAEAIDCVDGVLQDSIVYACKRGYAFCYEHATSEWCSNFAVYFVAYKAPEAVRNSEWTFWEDFKANSEIIAG